MKNVLVTIEKEAFLDMINRLQNKKATHVEVEINLYENEIALSEIIRE